MALPIVYLICGSTGSGKTTYSKKLVKEFRAINFSIDEWMKTLFWMDAPNPPTFEWAIERVSRCETLIWQQTKEASSLGYNVVLDLGFSEIKQRAKFYKLLKDAAISYELHFLDVPRDIRWERVSNRNNSLDNRSINVSRENFDWMESYFEPPTEEEQKENRVLRL